MSEERTLGMNNETEDPCDPCCIYGRTPDIDECRQCEHWDEGEYMDYLEYRLVDR